MRKVEAVCTTDDPIDSLEWHQKISKDVSDVILRPAFSPDKAMAADDVAVLNAYIGKLEAVTDISIADFDSYLRALKKRHDYFAANGCSISDHGLEQIYAEDYTDEEIRAIFAKIRAKQT